MTHDRIPQTTWLYFIKEHMLTKYFNHACNRQTLYNNYIAYSALIMIRSIQLFHMFGKIF